MGITYIPYKARFRVKLRAHIRFRVEFRVRFWVWVKIFEAAKL